MTADNLQRKGMEAAGFVDIQEFNYKVMPPPLSQGGHVTEQRTHSLLDPLRPLAQGSEAERARRPWAASL